MSAPNGFPPGSRDAVGPLRDVENHFLQVLVTELTLRRVGRGVELTVSVADDAPTIWSARGKAAVRSSIKDLERRAAATQASLDAFLSGGDATAERLVLDDPSFPFRYASGGVLPLVRFEEREYYVLHLREIFPIGWNIANGGCESRAELLSPVRAAVRELGEELVLFDRGRGVRYALDGAAAPAAGPELATELLRVDWVRGPDTMVVVTGDGTEHRTADCFVSVTAADFGVEIDRVARIELSRGTVPMDGELLDGLSGAPRPIDSPIGFFERGPFEAAVLADNGDAGFRPAIVFRSGERHDGSALERVVGEFIDAMESLRGPDAVGEYRRAAQPFGLCPAARSVARRFAAPG